MIQSLVSESVSINCPRVLVDRIEQDAHNRKSLAACNTPRRQRSDPSSCTNRFERRSFLLLRSCPLVRLVMAQVTTYTATAMAGMANMLIRRMVRRGSKGSDHLGNFQNRLPQPVLYKLPAGSPVGSFSCYSCHRGCAVTEVTELIPQERTRLASQFTKPDG
jgi:hypothetical protein